MKPFALILAGGSGGRFGSLKQFSFINGLPLFIHTINAFLDSCAELKVIVTIPKGHERVVDKYIYHYAHDIKRISVIHGGALRQDSVFHGVKVGVKTLGCDKVLISDACRPCIKPSTIQTFIKELEYTDCVIAVTKSVNTCCISSTGKFLDSRIDRTHMYDMLMPQCFNANMLLEAHGKSISANATDDTIILSNAFPDVKIKMISIPATEGFKVTYSEDRLIAERLLETS